MILAQSTPDLAGPRDRCDPARSAWRAGTPNPAPTADAARGAVLAQALTT